MKFTFKYEIKPNDKVSSDEIVNLILKHRNIKNIKEFLNPPSPLSIQISDFGFKKEIKTTLGLLKKIKKNNQTIVVYTDYDADGITGGAILWETLHLLGFNVMPYVPHRKLEGYGFSIKGIDAVKKQFDPALIISVDHGITAKEKVTYSKSIGIPIIITDHHLKPEKIPSDAKAIFHIPDLSGSGVSYFFSKMIFDHFKHKTSHLSLLTANFHSDYPSLASIGTIADLVPLTGPSRSLVKYGLEAFSQTKRPGLKAILKEAGIEGKKITPYEIGFIIAPRINAVGRLEHAIDALRLLCTRDPEKAHKLAANVGEKNRERQDMVTAAVKEAKEIVNSQNSLTLNKLIILVSKTWHEGIIGLIASKIAEEYYRPTIVITQSDGYFKGSARSISSFHITDFLRSLKKYLVDVGGHKGAAGFTIEKEKLDEFIEKTQKEANKLISEKDLKRKIEADIKIPLSKVILSIKERLTGRIIQLLPSFAEE
ncbi:DHH family phosphoesterase [Candidatus Roizmanbacteria bacterium]|nr:DHH family phosphoesterase [Candidatus Roizmanbacteria bacterium]